MSQSKNADEATSFKQLFQGMSPEGSEVVQGVVVSANPLKIQVVNNEKLILGESILIIPRYLTNYTDVIDISLGKGSISSITSTGGAHSHLGGTHDGHTDGNGEHSHDGGEHQHKLSTFSLSGVSMTVHCALKVGEKVHILAFNNSKKYYVLDRVV